MKKIVLFLIFLLYNNFIISQVLIGNYNSFLDTKYAVKATKPDKKGNFDFHIYTDFDKNVCQEVYFILKSKDIEEFKNFILKLKQNHIDWSKKLKLNEIQDLEREIGVVNNKYYAGYFKFNDWFYCKGIIFTPYFLCKSNIFITTIVSPKIYAEYNKFISINKISLSFSSEENFDSLISLLSIEKVIEKYKSEEYIDSILKN
jgi:hypothetical protein